MSPRLRSRRPLVIGLLVLLALAIGGTGYWYFELRGYVSTDDARLAGDLVDIGAEIPGRLTEVGVEVGNHVEKGQVLFRLDDASLKTAVGQAQDALALAQAGVDAAQAQLDKAKRGPRAQQIAMAKAAVARLAAQAHMAQISLDRVKRLHATGSAPQAMVDKSETQLEIALQAKAQADHQLTLLLQGTRREDLAAAAAAVSSAKARVQASQGALEQAKIRLSDAEVDAPFDGIVVRRWRDPGDMASPGAPVVTLFDPRTLRVDANIEETSIKNVAIGDPVEITVDAYPGKVLHGRVSTVVSATQSEFSAIPSAGVSGTFIKVTQRVPLRIKLDASTPAADALVPGLSVEVRIQSHGGKTGAVAER